MLPYVVRGFILTRDDQCSFWRVIKVASCFIRLLKPNTTNNHLSIKLVSNINKTIRKVGLFQRWAIFDQSWCFPASPAEVTGSCFVWVEFKASPLNHDLYSATVTKFENVYISKDLERHFMLILNSTFRSCSYFFLFLSVFITCHFFSPQL